MKCFQCQGDGHIAADCPDGNSPGGGKPPWCGICDPRTRLVGLGPDGPLARCATCHPLRGQLLRQHKRCSGCRMIIPASDSNPCGQHSTQTGQGLERERIDAIVAENGARE